MNKNKFLVVLVVILIFSIFVNQEMGVAHLELS